jgi:hypothetical protein
MAKKYGVTTIGRWLAEELPQGVKCYIEHHDKMFELVAVRGQNGILWPILRPLSTSWKAFQRYEPVSTTIDLNTQVVLSLGEELSGKPWDRVSQQLRPSAPNCWALTQYLTETTDDEATTIDIPDSSVYCG